MSPRKPRKHGDHTPPAHLLPSSLESDPLLVPMMDEMKTRHGCHTIVLYGSRALGTANIESDWDILGIRKEGAATRDARLFQGAFLDAFIVPEKDVVDKGPTMLHLRGGIPLIDPDGIGARLVADVARSLAAPPAPWPEAEITARTAWCRKMLGRIRRGGPFDVEANYRRAWLLVDLLELYFVLRHRHYLGPKESFRFLAKHDVSAHGLFSAALEPGASIERIEKLVACVLDA